MMSETAYQKTREYVLHMLSLTLSPQDWDDIVAAATEKGEFPETLMKRAIMDEVGR